MKEKKGTMKYLIDTSPNMNGEPSDAVRNLAHQSIFGFDKVNDILKSCSWRDCDRSVIYMVVSEPRRTGGGEGK